MNSASWYGITPLLTPFLCTYCGDKLSSRAVWMQLKFLFMFPRKNDLGAYAAHNFQKEFVLGRFRLWMLDDYFLQSGGIHYLGHYHIGY